MAQGCDKAREWIANKTDQGQAATASTSFTGPVTEVSEVNYDAFVSQKGHLVVVNFGADWCGPCRQLGPVLERVSLEFGDAVKLGKVDVDKARDVAMRSGVRSIPDVRFFRDGKQVHQFSGSQPEARIREDLKKFTNAEKTAKAAESEPESLLQRLLPGKEPDAKAETAEDEGPAIRPMEKDWLPPGIERR
ncbi:MAG: thioredoxin family protein [Luteolibacter sp.]